MSNPQTKTKIEGIESLERRRSQIRGLDEGIKNLVKVLNMLDFATTGSCEGHMDRWDPFPWVVMPTSLHSPATSNSVAEDHDVINPMNVLLENFNAASPVKWTFEVDEQPVTKFQTFGLLRPVHEAKDTSDLLELQESVEVLALYLYENFYKPFMQNLRKSA